MKIHKNWLCAFIAGVAVLAALILAYRFSSEATVIVKQAGFNTGQRNYKVAYDDKNAITLVSTYNNMLKAYNANGRELWSFSAGGPVREIKIHEDTKTVYAGCEDRNLYILDIENGNLKSTIKVQRRIYSIDINSDASIIAVSAGINALKHELLLYDNAGKQLWTKQTGIIAQKVSFNSDYTGLLIGNDRAEIVEYDLKGVEVRKKRVKYQVTDMSVDRSTGSLAVITQRGAYALFDRDLNNVENRDFGGRCTAVAVSEGAKWIAVGNEEGKFFFSDVKGNKIYESGASAAVTSVVFAGSKIFVTGLGDFVYTADRDSLHNIAMFEGISRYSALAACICTFVLLFLIVMSVDFLRRKVAAFFLALIRYKTAYLLLIPTFALLGVFCYYPVFLALTRAFTNWNIHETYIKFIGLDNFRLMIEEGYFLLGVRNLLMIIGTDFVKVLTVPLLVAELVFLMTGDRKKYWFRFLFVVPMVVPSVVSVLMWSNIYDPNIGLLNQLLDAVGLGGVKRVWLGDPETALWSIIGMGFPFVNAFAFLVYYGGLINIPVSLFEAAKVDGSNRWWDFVHIQLPLLMPQMKMLIILQFIGAVQDFSSILLLTGGGPGTATYTPGLELYYNATRFGRYGYACALGVVMFIAILAGTLLNMKIKSDSEYNN